MKHDIKKLPLWAQDEIHKRDQQIKMLQSLRSAHDILQNHDWFILPLKDAFEDKDHRNICLLERDSVVHLCSFGKDDILLIGRDWKKYGSLIDMGLMGADDSTAEE